jgi:ATP-binding cassette, subfamily G (WHITE), member 2, SNQ2
MSGPSVAHNEHSEEAQDSASIAELPTKEALAVHVSRSPRVPSQKTSPLIASTSSRPQQVRQGSCASRVDVDFFDPDGVRNLNRTLSHMSAAHVKDDSTSVSAISEETLITEGPFDFEKTLRTLMRR